MGREHVDPRETLLTTARRRDDLPAADATGLVSHDECPITQQEAQRADGNARPARYGDGLCQPRRGGILHVIAEHLTLRGSDEEILAAAVEPERGDLSRHVRRERLERLLPPTAPD